MDKSHYQEMDEIFHPGNVAIIGASPSSDIATQAQVKTKIRERLYPVNPKYKEIFGRICYPSILDVPVPVDYVIISVSAAMVPDVIQDCIRKGVKAAHIYSSGFAETGIKECIELENRLKAVSAGKIRIIGPNCFGIYCPKSGLAIVPESPEEEGGIGVISQSGSVAESFSYYARVKNLRFSKVVSYGNAIDLDCPDFLDYMADDPQTKIIALYIEGARDGARLRQSLSYAAGKKPVVVIKGGLSDNSNRIARSHTAQMTGTPQVWRALFEQCGVIQVSSFDDMVNTLIAFTHCRLPRGNGVTMISNSGGFSVIQADLCVSEGLDMPKFTDATIARLRQLVPVAGTSIGNPLDAWPVYFKVSEDGGNLADIIKVISADRNIDALVLLFDQFRYIRRVFHGGASAHVKTLTDVMLKGVRYVRSVLDKPALFSIVLDPFLQEEDEREACLMMKAALEQEGFAVFSSADAAMRSLSSLYRYAVRTGQAK